MPQRQSLCVLIDILQVLRPPTYWLLGSNKYSTSRLLFSHWTVFIFWLTRKYCDETAFIGIVNRDGPHLASDQAPHRTASAQVYPYDLHNSTRNGTDRGRDTKEVHLYFKYFNVSTWWWSRFVSADKVVPVCLGGRF